MPDKKSLIRLIIVVVIVAAYYLGPVLLGKTRHTPVGLALGDVQRLEFSGLPGGAQAFKRDRQGRWQPEDDRGLPADQTRLLTFLEGLATGQFTAVAAANVPNPAVTVKLSTGGGKSLTVELGARLAPFAQQELRLDGQGYRVDRDLSACLGLWQGSAPAPLRLLDPVVVDLGTDEPVDLALRNPFASYSMVRGAEPRTEEVGEKREEPIYPWLGARESKGLETLARAGHQWQRRLAVVGVRELAGPELLRKFPLLYQVDVKTEKEQTFRLEFSGTINADQDHLLRASTQPERLFVVSRETWSRCTPQGTYLFKAMPRVDVKATDATAAKVSRDGREFELKLDGKKWRMVSPEVPLDLWVPPALPPDKPRSMAIHYLEGLLTFIGSELFDARPPEKKRLLDQYTANPVATVELALPGGQTLTLSASREVTGTGMCFLRIGDKVLVVSTYVWDTLGPEVKTFYDPEELKKRNLAL